MEGFCVGNLIKTYNIIFSEYGLSCKIVADIGKKLFGEIQQLVQATWHMSCSIILHKYQSSRQAGTCIKIVKRPMKIAIN